MNKNFLIDLKNSYGKNEHNGRAPYVVGPIFCIIGFLLFCGMYCMPKFVIVSLFEKVVLCYLSEFMVVVGLWVLAASFYTDKATALKGKAIKSIFFWLLTLLLTISISPVFIVIYLRDKAKLSINDKTWLIYVTIIVSDYVVIILGSLCVGLAYSIPVEDYPFYVGIFVILAFMLILYEINKFALWIVKKNKKLSDEEKKGISDDFYVFRFVCIAIVAVIVNLLRLDEVTRQVAKDINSAIAIYIAFDRVLSKYERVHKEEKKIEQK